MTSHTSIETVTAALQLQQARNDQPINSDIPRSASCDRPVTTQHDITLTTNSFNSSSAGGGVILGDIRGARLAIESDNSIAGFPTVASCLITLQPLPTDFIRVLHQCPHKLLHYN